jgi:RimJ/RimL family protein N-acetyltransferase
MNITFDALTLLQAESIRQERNKNMQILRTSYLLTQQMQTDFYCNTICNRSSNSRYFAVKDSHRFIGMVGIENIEWENSRGEISIIIREKYQKKGYGGNVVKKIIEKAFEEMNLNQVWGECYFCNIKGIKFWENMIRTIPGSFFTYIKNTKFYNNRYYDSLYFSFTRRK